MAGQCAQVATIACSSCSATWDLYFTLCFAALCLCLMKPTQVYNSLQPLAAFDQRHIIAQPDMLFPCAECPRMPAIKHIVSFLLSLRAYKSNTNYHTPT